MQFQVPQFIEAEDKIVGPLSIRQFIIVAAGIGLSALLYFILQIWLWIVLSIPIVGLAVALAFVRISGRPFWKVILSATHFYWTPQTYVWQAERGHAAAPASGEEKAAKVFTGPVAPLRAKAASGAKLHEHWETLQTGEKLSQPQFTEQRMYERYQIFQKLTGDRAAARRVDYR